MCFLVLKVRRHIVSGCLAINDKMFDQVIIDKFIVEVDFSLCSKTGK